MKTLYLFLVAILSLLSDAPSLRADIFKFQWQSTSPDPQWSGVIYTRTNSGQITSNDITAVFITTPQGTLDWHYFAPQSYYVFGAYPNFTPPITALYDGGIPFFELITQSFSGDVNEGYNNFTIMPADYKIYSNYHDVTTHPASDNPLQTTGFWIYEGNANPVITNQPSSGSTPAGGQANLCVGVAGEIPLVYQWFFNGTNLLLTIA